MLVCLSVHPVFNSLNSCSFFDRKKFWKDDNAYGHGLLFLLCLSVCLRLSVRLTFVSVAPHKLLQKIKWNGQIARIWYVVVHITWNPWLTDFYGSYTPLKFWTRSDMGFCLDIKQTLFFYLNKGSTSIALYIIWYIMNFCNLHIDKQSCICWSTALVPA